MHKFWHMLTRVYSSSGIFFVLVLVFIYFSFYAVRGDRGLIRYMNLTREVASARRVSAEYANQKEEWSDKVKRLSSESLDLDMLDEQARVVLNMVGPKEFVILDSDLEE